MQRLKEEVRARICLAALEEFKQNGYADASIRKISDRAEISLGNIYRYFENKEALYLAVVQPFRDAIKDFIEVKYAIRGETVASLSKDVLNFVSNHKNELEIIVRGNSHHEISFMEFLVEMTAVKIKRIVDNKMSQFKKNISNDNLYNLIAQTFLSALFDLLNSDLPYEEMQKDLTDLMTFFFGQVGRD